MKILHESHLGLLREYSSWAFVSVHCKVNHLSKFVTLGQNMMVYTNSSKTCVARNIAGSDLFCLVA